MNGKGSKRRPQQVDDKKMQDNWDRIFNKKQDMNVLINNNPDFTSFNYEGKKDDMAHTN